MSEKIIEKIKKCLALSESTNEYEAAQALKHAHALMAKYNISQELIDLSKINELSTEAKASFATWHLYLIETIELVFCVCALINSKRGTVSFNGFNKKPEIAKYVYEVLFRQCNRARTGYIKTHLRAVRTKKDKTFRANSYATGWVNTVQNEIEKFITEKDRAEYQHARTITLTRTDIKVGDFFKAKDEGKLSVNDFFSGADDGKNVRLFLPVDSTTSVQIKDKP